MRLIIIISFLFILNNQAGEKDFPKLHYSNVSSFFKSIEFSEVKLTDEQMKLLTGKESESNLKLKIWSPKKPFFVTQQPKAYFDLSTILSSSMSKRAYYTDKMIDMHHKYIKSGEHSLQDEKDALRKKLKEMELKAKEKTRVYYNKMMADYEKRKQNAKDPKAIDEEIEQFKNDQPLYLEANLAEYTQSIEYCIQELNKMEEYFLTVKKKQLPTRAMKDKFQIYSSRFFRSETPFHSNEPLILGIVEISLKDEVIYVIIKVKFLLKDNLDKKNKRYLFTNDFIIKRNKGYHPLSGLEYYNTDLSKFKFFDFSILEPTHYIALEEINKRKDLKKTYSFFETLFNHKPIPEWIDVKNVPVVDKLPSK